MVPDHARQCLHAAHRCAPLGSQPVPYGVGNALCFFFTDKGIRAPLHKKGAGPAKGQTPEMLVICCRAGQRSTGFLACFAFRLEITLFKNRAFAKSVRQNSRTCYKKCASSRNRFLCLLPSLSRGRDVAPTRLRRPLPRCRRPGQYRSAVADVDSVSCIFYVIFQAASAARI